MTARVALCEIACVPAPPLAVTVATKEFVDGPVDGGATDEPVLLQPVSAPKAVPTIKNATSRNGRFPFGKTKRKTHARVRPAAEPAIPPACRRSRTDRAADDTREGRVMLSATLAESKPSRLG